MVVCTAWLILPSPALAEEPFRLDSQIEDRAGALGGRRAEVEDALARLQEEQRVQLWVAYVDTFSGHGAQEWADATAVDSDLGLRDVLLAVAVEDRAYAYSVDQDFPLSDAQLNDIMSSEVEPYLSKDDWAGAVVGASEGMTRALGQAEATTTIQTGATTTTAGGAAGGSGSGIPWGAVLAVAVLLGGGFLIWSAVRRSRSGAARLGGPAGPGGTPQQVPAETLEELRRRVSAELVETDDAIKTSSDEVGFAIAEFGAEQAAPFQSAVEEARRELDQAFRLHKQLGDTNDEPGQRALLTAVLQHTVVANERLDTQSERFDRLRDLEKQAPEVFAGLDGQLPELEARVPLVRQELAELAAVYSAAALSSVAANPDEAASRLSFAREEARAGREDLSAGRRGEAAVSALAAQEAAAQAQALLDAVGRVARDLAEARGRIEDAIAETRRDIAEAQASGAGGQLTALVATAQQAVDAAAQAAAPEGGRDPLAALRHLEKSDEALEAALQQVREAQAQRASAIAALDRTLLAARAQIAAASDYITTHRGAVSSGPRELLAQAQHHVDQAVALGGSDPVSAARRAATAHDLAANALRGAQAETQRATTMPGMPGTGAGGDIAGAILGGILANVLMGGRGSGGRSIFADGGSSGGFGGGFSGGGRRGGGGFAPPSFGGSGTRMRRGGGGRF